MSENKQFIFLNYLSQIRTPSQEARQPTCSLVLIIILGAAVGFFDAICNVYSVMPVRTVLQSLGFWAFCVTLIAYYAPAPKLAMLRTISFLVPMCIIYYFIHYFFYGEFDLKLFAFWFTIAIISTCLSYLLWYSNGSSLFSTFLLAIPFSMFIYEVVAYIYSAMISSGKINFEFGLIVLVINSIFAVYFLMFLSKRGIRRLQMALIGVSIAIVLLLIVELTPLQHMIPNIIPRVE